MLGRYSFTSLFLLLALVVLGNLPVAAYGQEEGVTDLSAGEQLQALIETGQEQFGEGDYEAAVATFSQVIQGSGGYSAGPLLLIAKAYAQLEEYEASLEDLKNALTYGQGQPAIMPEIQNTRGEVYMRLHAYQQALPDFQAATKANRSNQQYQFNLGKTLVKLGGAQLGEKALTNYLESDSAAEEEEQRGEALALRGQAYVGLNKPEKALADFAASLEIDPTNHEVFMGRSSLALQKKDYPEAVKQLRLSIENYTPEDEEDELPFIQGYLTLGFALEEVGKAADDEATAVEAYTAQKAECEKLLALLPEDNQQVIPSKAAALFRRGVAERLLGDLGDAVRSFSQATQLNPALGEAYFRRGICFFYLGEERLAIRDFEQAASINFDSPRANLWKGAAWAKLGDYNEAVRSYGESIAVSDRYIPAYVNRGLAQMQLGAYQKAVDNMNEAIRLQPTEGTHYYRRGRAFSFLGDRDKAIQSYMAAISFDAQLAPAYHALIAALQANGQSELANEYRQRAAELQLNAGS